MIEELGTLLYYSALEYMLGPINSLSQIFIVSNSNFTILGQIIVVNMDIKFSTIS